MSDDLLTVKKFQALVPYISTDLCTPHNRLSILFRVIEQLSRGDRFVFFACVRSVISPKGNERWAHRGGYGISKTPPSSHSLLFRVLIKVGPRALSRITCLHNQEKVPLMPKFPGLVSRYPTEHLRPMRHEGLGYQVHASREIFLWIFLK